MSLKEKFDREYFFNDDINSKNNKQSRNKNQSKTTIYKSLNNKNKISPNDISNKLYNMQKIINEKINKKKEEIEQKEMINCTFIPKINYNSKKIMEKLENKNKNKEKYKIIDLIPRINKSSNMLNSYKDQFLINKAKMQDNHENDELRQYNFKHKINKNHSFCYRNPNNIKNKYNTIDLPQENIIYRALNINNECDMNNNDNQVNKAKNIKQTFLKNNYQKNKQIINENNYNKLYLNNEGIDNYKKNVEEYYNSNYNSNYNFNYNIPEKNEYNKYIYSNIINKTESNNNYFNYNDNFCDNLSSKQNFNNNNIISQNDKIINSTSLRNLYHNNLNNNYVYEPQIYKNRNYINNQYDCKNEKIKNINKIKEIQIGYNTGNNNIFLNDNENYRPIKLNENLELMNDNIYRKGKIMPVDNNNNCIQKPYERLSYQNQDYNRGVYIKKTVKNFSRNFSYTHRNNKLNLNDACYHKYNDEIINNRMLIKKLLFEEE